MQDFLLSHIAENFSAISENWISCYSLEDDYRYVMKDEILNDLLSHPRLELSREKGESGVFLFLLACLACQCGIECLEDFPRMIPLLENEKLTHLRSQLAKHIGNCRIFMVCPHRDGEFQKKNLFFSS